MVWKRKFLSTVVFCWCRAVWGVLSFSAFLPQCKHNHLVIMRKKTSRSDSGKIQHLSNQLSPKHQWSLIHTHTHKNVGYSHLDVLKVVGKNKKVALMVMYHGKTYKITINKSKLLVIFQTRRLKKHIMSSRALEISLLVFLKENIHHTQGVISISQIMHKISWKKDTNIPQQLHHTCLNNNVWSKNPPEKNKNNHQKHRIISLFAAGSSPPTIDLLQLPLPPPEYNEENAWKQPRFLSTGKRTQNP